MRVGMNGTCFQTILFSIGLLKIQCGLSAFETFCISLHSLLATLYNTTQSLTHEGFCELKTIYSRDKKILLKEAM